METNREVNGPVGNGTEESILCKLEGAETYHGHPEGESNQSKQHSADDKELLSEHNAPRRLWVTAV